MMSAPGAFTYEPAMEVSRARRVLIKPAAAYPAPYPVTTSRELLAAVIRGVRRVSEADIILLEGPAQGEHTRSVFRALGYDFPRVLSLDVRDCTLVEVENPLFKPHTLANFWVPNVLLSCDYLISAAPCKVVNGTGSLAIANLVGLLPKSKYGEDLRKDRSSATRLDVQGLIADLYFTVPFDLGVVDASVNFVTHGPGSEGVAEPGRGIFFAEPYDVDLEVAGALGIDVPYLRLIAIAREELEATPAGEA